MSFLVGYRGCSLLTFFFSFVFCLFVSFIADIRVRIVCVLQSLNSFLFLLFHPVFGCRKKYFEKVVYLNKLRELPEQQDGGRTKYFE